MYKLWLTLAIFTAIFIPSNGFILKKKWIFDTDKTETTTIQQIHQVYGPPTTTEAPKEPLLTKDDYNELFNALKDQIKFVNPFTWIKNKVYRKFGLIKTVPEYQLKPELGFVQYNQIKYVPLVQIKIDPSPVAPIEPSSDSSSDVSEPSKPYA